MITKAVIKNFQSLKNVTLEFGAVTSITGHSDVGKSAFIRAITALVLNRTSEGLMHKGKGPLHVVLYTDDGHSVGIFREKGKSAVYEIDGKDFIKTGREVPDEVANMLRMREYLVDKDVKVLPCIQSQLGPQFLIQHSDTVVSKTIGRISNISIVFAAIRKAHADVIALQQDVSTQTAQLESTERDLEPLSNIDTKLSAFHKVNKLAQVAAELEKKIEVGSELADTLSSLSQRTEKLEFDVKGSAKALRAFDKLVETAEAHGELAKVSGEMSKIVVQARHIVAFEKATVKVLAAVDQRMKDLQRLRVLYAVKCEMDNIRKQNNEIVATAKAETEQFNGTTELLETKIKHWTVCPLIQDEFQTGCNDKLVQLSRK